MMRPPFMLIGAIAAFLAVALGAFGAHGLKSVVSANRMDVYHTAINYLMWHALALGLIALYHKNSPSKWLCRAGWAMCLGMVLFSGSLILLVMLDQARLGMITPFGGISLLAGWLMLIYHAYQAGE